MKINHGILISEDGKGIEEGPIIYDSRKKKPLIDYKADPKHLDIITINGGTKFRYASGQYGVREERIFTRPHRYGYPPQVFAYIYVQDAPASAVLGGGGSVSGGGGVIGRYGYGGIGFGQSINGQLQGYFEQWVVIVDDTNVYINHWVNRNAGTGTITTMGSDFTFRIKLMITSMRNIGDSSLA